MGRFVHNPAFESELRRDPENKRPVKEAADDTAEDANENVRAMFRPAVMTPFMPKGGYRSQGGRRPVRSMDVAGDIYVSNFDFGAAIYEWGAITPAGYVVPAAAPLRRAARKNARLVE